MKAPSMASSSSSSQEKSSQEESSSSAPKPTISHLPAGNPPWREKAPVIAKHTNRVEEEVPIPIKVMAEAYRLSFHPGVQTMDDLANIKFIFMAKVVPSEHQVYLRGHSRNSTYTRRESKGPRSRQAVRAALITEMYSRLQHIKPRRTRKNVCRRELHLGAKTPPAS